MSGKRCKRCWFPVNKEVECRRTLKHVHNAVNSPWLHRNSAKVHRAVQLSLDARLEQVTHAHARSSRTNNNISFLFTPLESSFSLGHRVTDDAQVERLKVEVLQDRQQGGTVRVDDGRE